MLADEVAKRGLNGEWITLFCAPEGMGRLIVAPPRAPMARFKTGEVSPSAVQRAKFSIRAHSGVALPHTAALEILKLHVGDLMSCLLGAELDRGTATESEWTPAVRCHTADTAWSFCR